MRRGLNILALTCLFPRPDQAAGDRRFVNLLALLARSHRVDLFVYGCRDSPPEPGLSALRTAGVNVLPTDPRGWLYGHLRRNRYDLGVFEFYPAMAEHGPSFRDLQPWAKVVVDTVDVHFARESAAVRLGLLDAATATANREHELAAYRTADALMAVTDEDRRALYDVGDMPATYLVPIILPTRPRPARSRCPEAVFVGGFTHRPNIDGVLWLAERIWPLVRARVPEAVLTLVGSNPPPDVLALDGRDGVTVTGYVPDTAPYLDRAAVSVAPLRFGAGMKGKVTEALAAGVPVVTTSVGAQGFGLLCGEHALIADGPESFAEAVVRFLTDPAEAERIGAAGRSRVSALCTPDAVGRQLEAMLDELFPSGERHPPPLRWRVSLARNRVVDLAHYLKHTVWPPR